MWLLNFNKKSSIICEEENYKKKGRLLSKSLSSWGYTDLSLPLILRWKKLSINYWKNCIYFSKVKIWMYRGDGMGRNEKQHLV